MDLKPQTRLLELCGITKTIANEKVIENLCLDIYKGEIHGIVGEKGAGKSLLAKIIGGVIPYRDYTGELKLEDKPVTFGSPRDSEKAGISTVYQEFNLVGSMSAYENICLGNEKSTFGLIRWRENILKANQLLGRFDLGVISEKYVMNLSHGEQQIVKICKALTHDFSILVLDEATDGLTEDEVKKLFAMLVDLKNQGRACFYLTHEIKDVFKIANRISVLKAGKIVYSSPINALDEETLLESMTGRRIVRGESRKILLERYGITDREKDIMLLLFKGYNNHEIGSNLAISINTVKTHIASIYQKTDAKNRVDLSNIFKGLL
jgi:ABC-type sugar transport system ATPase subunit